MSMKFRLAHWLSCTVSAVLFAAPGFASAFGTLSNFDVVNDTPGDCHGFEIELEDIHSSDVPYTFGGSYIRYGTPEIEEITVDPLHPRVIVRYRHWNGSTWEATPVAPAGVSPGGHDCYASGPIGNYSASGCEHFGVSLGATPSRTSYRWLVAADPSDMNTTFSVVPQSVDLPVPVWNVIPNPGGGGGVNVIAEVEPLEEENHAQHGEPQWMKVFKIESELDLEPEDLVLLLLGGENNILPDETEIETEWKLIQSKPGDAEDEEEDADVKEDPLDDGKHSVVRRYEFYHYTGPRDPENNEALPCIDDDAPVPPDEPVEGCSDLGEFIGAQNVAVDVGEGVAPTPTDTAEATPTDTPEATPTDTVEATPTETGEATPTDTVEATPTETVEVTPTETAEATPTETAEATPTETAEATPTETGEATPTETAEATPTETAEATPTETAEATPTETGEATPTDTAEATPTGTVEATPTETAESTPTEPIEICTGDCDGGGEIRIAELITLVRIALGTSPPSSCPAGLEPGAEVNIALLVRAVGNALDGCPAG